MNKIYKYYKTVHPEEKDKNLIIAMLGLPKSVDETKITDEIQEIFDKNKDQVEKIKLIFDKIAPIDQNITKLIKDKNINEISGAINDFPNEIYGILFGSSKNPDYNKLYERLFNPGFVFREKEIFDENFFRLNSGYQPDRIFTFKNPIIKNILSPYVDEIDGKSIVSDYKVFYLFANYGQEIEKVGQLKCANQNELLITTRNFIESVTK